MARLIVPDAFAGLHVERDQARAEEVVARPESAPEVHRRAVGRDEDQSPFGVGRERRPGRNIAGRFPGVVLPRLVAELARPRQHAELPEELPGPRVVGEDVARHVFVPRLVVALLGGVADDDDAVDDDGRRRARDVALLERDAFVRIVRVTEVLQQIDRPGFRKSLQWHRATEALERLTRMRVERVQEERRRDDVHDVASADVGVGHALAVILPHRVFPAEGGRLPERPERFTGAGVHRDDVPAIACDRDEHPVDVNRDRPREHVAEALAVPLPRDFELVEVLRRDLIEPRVALVAGVAADRRPPAVRRGRLPGRGRPSRHDHQRANDDDESRRPCRSTHRVSP